MGKVKESLIIEEENKMEQDELDAMWHQKQLDEHEQQLMEEHEQQQGELGDLLRVARERNLFEQQALCDAIAYGHSLRTPKVVR